MSTLPPATRLRRGLLVGLLGLGMVFAPISLAAAAEAEIDIPDPAFRACLNSALDGRPLTEENLGNLPRVICGVSDSSTIRSIAGAEHLTSARSLVLHESLLADLGPIGALPQLTGFRSGIHRDTDTTPLASLPELERLELAPVFRTQNLSMVSDLEHLRWLQLTTGDTQLPDLGGSVEAELVSVSGPHLTNLDGLQGLDADLLQVLGAGELADLTALRGSRITELSMGNSRGTPDLGPLGEVAGLEVLNVQVSGNDQLSNIRRLTSLRELRLDSRDLTDLSTMQPPSALERLTVYSDELADLGPPSSLRQLKELRTWYARKIVSLEALRGTTSLTFLEMPGSSIGDLSPISGIPDGATLDLRENRIPDFTPLSGWSGTLKATDQAVALPRVLADVPTSVRLLAPDGSYLKPSANNDPWCDYSSGELTCSQGQSYPLRFYSGATEAESPITMGGYVEVERRAFAKLGTPVISATGQVRVGQAVTAQPGSWSPQPDRFTYQWYAKGTPIPGATSATYVPNGTEGEFLGLQVTAHRLSYHETPQWADLATVVASTLARTPTPAIRHSGRLATGTTLTAESGSWDPGVTLVHQWQRDKKNITGATSAAYTVTAADVGHKLRVRVTGTKPGHHVVAKNSAQVTPSKATFAASAKPTIAGTRAVGKKLTAKVEWKPTTATLKYQWYRNGKKIRNATKASYTLKASDVNDRFSVRVTAGKSGYASVSKTSAKTAKVKRGRLMPGSATIKGAATVGQKLTASITGWAPGQVSLSYRWYRDGKAIKGATARSYQVKKADAGHRLSLRVTGKKPGYTTKTITSAAVISSAP